MTQRHTGALLGALLGFASPALATAVPDVPVVRFVEVGDAGVVFSDAAFRVLVEVATRRPFRGTLVTTYRWAEDGSWDEGLRGVQWGDRARVPLDLKPGTERLHVSIPAPCRATSRAGRDTLLEAVWTLVDQGGRALASGRQAARPEIGPALRVLRLTTEAGDGFRRAPAAAWEAPERYEPYATVLVTREDLAGLGGRQRQALFDAVALGLTLVVTATRDGGRIEPLGPPFDGALTRERALWKGAAGEEIREARLLWGRIRRSTLAVSAAPERADDPELVRWMLLTAPRSRLDASRNYVPDESWHLAKTAERARSVRLGALATDAAVALVLALLFAGSRKSGSPRRLPLTAALVTCLAAPPLLYAFLAGRRAGNSDWRFRVTTHDGVGPVASVGTYASRGGGGGSRPVSVPLETPRRGIVATASPSRLTFAPGLDGIPRATAANDVVAPFAIVLSFSRSLVPPEALWHADLRIENGRLAGTLTARRAVKDAWILGPAGTGGGRVGAVPAGGRVELSSFAFSGGRPPLEGDSSTLPRAFMGRADSWMFDLPWTFWAPPETSPVVLASEEPAAEDGTAVYDYQGLSPDGAADEELVEVPAVAKGGELHVAIPTALSLPDDVGFCTSRYPWADRHSGKAERFGETRDGVRLAIVPGRARPLDTWAALRPDLPRGAGYVAVRATKGTRR